MTKDIQKVGKNMGLKVGIVGNYGHNNNGDEAILAGILNQIKGIDGNCDITIFSNTPSDTIDRYNLKTQKFKYNKGNTLFSIIYTIGKVYKNLKELDLIIIGGGQLLMDLYSRGPMLYAMYSILGKLAGKTVIYHAVGAGPISTKIGKFFIGLGLKNATSISVRDIQSKELLDKKYGIGDKVILAADPAFSLENKHNNKEQTNKTIGFTTLPYFNGVYWPGENMDKYNRYIGVLQETIQMLLDQTDYNILLFSTAYPADTISSTDLYNRINSKNKDRLINRTDNLHPQQLLETISECDLIIGTRLHSLILAIVGEKPIIGIEYQPKVRNFMERVGLQDSCFKIDIMEAEEIYNLVTNTMKDSNKYKLAVSKSSQALKQMREEIDGSLNVLENVMKNI